MVKGSSPKMASPPDTTAMTRMATKETPNEMRAAFLSPRPAENGSEIAEPNQVIEARAPDRDEKQQRYRRRNEQPQRLIAIVPVARAWHDVAPAAQSLFERIFCAFVIASWIT